MKSLELRMVELLNTSGLSLSVRQICVYLGLDPTNEQLLQIEQIGYDYQRFGIFIVTDERKNEEYRYCSRLEAVCFEFNYR